MPLVLRCNQDRSASVRCHKRNIVSPAILAADLNRAATNCRSIVIPNKSVSPGWFWALPSKTVGFCLRGMSSYSFRLCASYSDVILGLRDEPYSGKSRRGGSKERRGSGKRSFEGPSSLCELCVFVVKTIRTPGFSRQEIGR